MRALLYADWTVVHRTFLRYLLVSLLCVSPIVALGNADGELSAGVAVAASLVMMVTVYLAIGLFSADETNGWEQVRLALPTSARQVVRSRYAFVALVTAGTAVEGTLAGTLVQLAMPLLYGPVMAPRDVVTIGLAALGAGLVALVLLTLEMPIIFCLGVTKARMALSVPFVLCYLFVIEPVRNALMPLLDGLEALEAALGSPAPLFAAGAVLVAVLYLASMRLSERLYAARDF